MRSSSAYHVWRSEVAHDTLIRLGLDDLCDLLGNTLDTHLRVLVVGGNLRRRDHVALFVVELLLDTTVEEERDMRILLRFWMGVRNDRTSRC